MAEHTFFLPLNSWAPEDLAAVRGFLAEILPPPVRSFLDSPDPSFPDLRDDFLRPALLLLAARHHGCRSDRPVRLAAGIHMIHLASWLHDRLGEVRPGEAWGADAAHGGRHHRESMDILVGDFFFACASSLFVEDGEERIIRDMIRTSTKSVEAQATLVSARYENGEAGPDARRCIEAAADKVSLLFALALRVGCRVAAAAEADAERLSGYGSLLGRAYRICRDLRFWLGCEPYGVGTHGDLGFSHPLLLLLQQEGVDAWREAARVAAAAPHEAPGELADLLDRTGCLEDSLSTARRLAGEALDRLSRGGGAPPPDPLVRIAEKHLFEGIEGAPGGCV